MDTVAVDGSEILDTGVPVDDEIDSDALRPVGSGSGSAEHLPRQAEPDGTWRPAEPAGFPSPEAPIPQVAAAPSAQAGLTEREQAMLAFERQWWRHAGAKEQAIRDQFAVSSTRYYQVLNELLDNPRALIHDPVLVGRLRRLRATRLRTRQR